MRVGGGPQDVGRCARGGQGGQGVRDRFGVADAAEQAEDPGGRDGGEEGPQIEADQDVVAGVGPGERVDAPAADKTVDALVDRHGGQDLVEHLPLEVAQAGLRCLDQPVGQPRVPVVAQAFVAGVTVDLATVGEPVELVAVETEELGQLAEIADRGGAPAHVGNAGRDHDPPPDGGVAGQADQETPQLAGAVGGRTRVRVQDDGDEAASPGWAGRGHRPYGRKQLIFVPGRGEQRVGHRARDHGRWLRAGSVSRRSPVVPAPCRAKR